MSADNGIYILKTKATDDKHEYRIAYACAIENCFLEDGLPFVCQIFRDKPPLRSEKSVEKVTRKMKNELLKDGYHIEYGITHINNFESLTFTEIQERAKMTYI